MRRLALLLLLPFLLAATPIIETTGSIDFSGATTGESITITFESTGSSGGANDGGGGGGEGGEPDPCLQPPIKTSHSYDLLQSGSWYTLKGPNNQFWIKQLRFQVNQTKEGGVTFLLTHIRNIVCETIPPVPGDRAALAYERVDYVGVSGKEIKPGVQINFSVQRSHLDDNEVVAGEVELWRYDGVNWEALPTRLVQELSSIVHYAATSPGLSHFAITVPAPPEGETYTTPENEENRITGGATRVGGDGEGRPPAEEEGEESPPAERRRDSGGGFPLWSLLVVLLIGGALLGYYLYDKKKEEKAVDQQVATGKEQKEEPTMGFAEIGEEALGGAKDQVEELHDYVDKELRMGFHREEIAAQLRKVGWQEEIITKVLDDFRPGYLAKRGMHSPHNNKARLRAFLQEKVALGYDKGIITRSLVKAGWDEALIKKELEQL